MSDQQSDEKVVHFPLTRPSRERVFYSNAANLAFNEQQEAIFDFRLVMPEDLQVASQTGSVEDDEIVEAKAGTIEIRQVPIEVRVYMPFNQFLSLCGRMARLWEKFKASAEDQSQTNENESTESEAVYDG